MTMKPEEAAHFADIFARMAASVGSAILGKDREVRLVLTAMFAEGHVLLEDAPGTGKTSLAKALAAMRAKMSAKCAASSGFIVMSSSLPHRRGGRAATT